MTLYWPYAVKSSNICGLLQCIAFFVEVHGSFHGSDGSLHGSTEASMEASTEKFLPDASTEASAEASMEVAEDSMEVASVETSMKAESFHGSYFMVNLCGVFITQRHRVSYMEANFMEATSMEATSMEAPVEASTSMEASVEASTSMGASVEAHGNSMGASGSCGSCGSWMLPCKSAVQTSASSAETGPAHLSAEASMVAASTDTEASVEVVAILIYPHRHLYEREVFRPNLPQTTICRLRP